MKGKITYDDDGDTEEIGLTSIAEYIYGDSEIKLTYKEYPEENNVNKKSDDFILNTITVHPDNRLTLTKSTKDGISSILVLEKDMRHLCVYNTPFGSFEMGIFTTSLIVRAKENECRISVCYTTDIEKENIRHHRLDISLREKKHS